ncbi:response regulator transcription factor, partial [Amycolatopsis japonica]
VNSEETRTASTERVLAEIGRFPQKDDGTALTETETGILELVRTGRTNRQIARAVRLSEKTVEKHLTRLFAKAGCRTRYGLATSNLGRRTDAIGA